MRIVLFTGKGGVGKTTTAAATAVRLADRGTKTLLLSTDGAHSVADALDTPLTAQPAEVEPGLWAVQLDAQGRFEQAWRDVQDFLLDLLARGGVDPVTADELTVLPGIEEVLALLSVRELAVEGDWDAVVVDCAPTAETLRLLALPEALGWYLQRGVPAQQALARTLRPFVSLLGRGIGGGPNASHRVVEALVRLTDELAAVRALLGDPAVTSVRLVLTPESMVVAETRRTFTALSLYGYAVDEIVANRVVPDGGDAWRQGWAAAQRTQLAAVRDSFAGRPVREVGYRPGEPLGLDALRALADDLYGARPGGDPAARASSGPAMRIETADGGYALRLPLPLARRADVDAARVGDDLVLTVGPHRRVLALPAVLRRSQVVGGRFADGELTVRFRADPARRPRPGPGPFRGPAR